MGATVRLVRQWEAGTRHPLPDKPDSGTPRFGSYNLLVFRDRNCGYPLKVLAMWRLWRWSCPVGRLKTGGIAQSLRPELLGYGISRNLADR